MRYFWLAVCSVMLVNGISSGADTDAASAEAVDNASESGTPTVRSSRRGMNASGGFDAGNAFGGNSGGGPGGGFREIENQLKESYPDEYAEITELRKTDPRQAMEKMRTLMETAGISMGRGMRGSRGGDRGSRDNASGATATENIETVSVDRNFRRRQMEVVNRELERRYPDDYKELETLRSDDPETARYCFVELLARLKADGFEWQRQALRRYEARGLGSGSGDESTSNGDNGGMPPGPPDMSGGMGGGPGGDMGGGPGGGDMGGGMGGPPPGMGGGF